MTAINLQKLPKLSVTFPVLPTTGIGTSWNSSDFSQHRCHCSPVNSIVVDTKASLLYSAGRDATIRTWSFGNHQLLKSKYAGQEHATIPTNHRTVCIKEFDSHVDWVNDIQISPDGTRLVSCSSDKSVGIFNLDSLYNDPWSDYLGASKQVTLSKSNRLSKKLFFYHQDYVKKVKCHIYNDILHVASTALDGKTRLIRVLNDGTAENVAVYETNSSNYSLASLPVSNGFILATGDSNGLIRLFDTRQVQSDSQSSIAKLDEHRDVVKSLSFFSPTSFDNSNKLKNETIHNTSSGISQQRDIHTLPSLVSASSDGSIKIWEFRMMKAVATLVIHEDSVWTLADGRDFVNCFEDNRSFGLNRNEPQRNDHKSIDVSQESGLCFFSGGRDGSVYYTKFSNSGRSETRHVLKDQNPILSIAPTFIPQDTDEHQIDTSSHDHDQSPSSSYSSDVPYSLWIATTSPTITRWNCSVSSLHRNFRYGSSSNGTNSSENSNLNTDMINSDSSSPPNIDSSKSNLIIATSPILQSAFLNSQSESIPSTVHSSLEIAFPIAPLLNSDHCILSQTPIRPAIVQHLVLTDKTGVITRDSSGRCILWNIEKLKLQRDLGIVENLDNLEKKLSKPLSWRNNWFTADTKSGLLTIHFEPPTRCFEAVRYEINGVERLRHYLMLETVLNLFERNLVFMDDENSTNNQLHSNDNKSTRPEEPSPSTSASAVDSAENSKVPNLPEPPLDVSVIIGSPSDSRFEKIKRSEINEDTKKKVEDWMRLAHKTPDKLVENPSLIQFTFKPHRDNVPKTSASSFTMQSSFPVHGMKMYLTRQKGFPFEDIQIYAKDTLLDDDMDLASIKYFMKGDLVITYDCIHHRRS